MSLGCEQVSLFDFLPKEFNKCRFRIHGQGFLVTFDQVIIGQNLQRMNLIRISVH